MANLWTSLVEADYIDAACDTNVPTLITYGQLSQVYDEEAAAWMDENVPKSRRVPFLESGHAPHIAGIKLNSSLELRSPARGMSSDLTTSLVCYDVDSTTPGHFLRGVESRRQGDRFAPQFLPGCSESRVSRPASAPRLP